MYARIITIQYHSEEPEKMERGARIYQTSVVPALKQQCGFINELALLNRSTGKFVEISFWRTEAHMKAGIKGSFVMEQLARLASLTTGAFTLGTYEVLDMQEPDVRSLLLPEMTVYG